MSKFAYNSENVKKYVNLAMFAAAHGYEKVKAKYTANYPVLEHPETNHRILIGRNPDNDNWLFKNPREGDKWYTIIDFVMDITDHVQMRDILAYIKNTDLSGIKEGEYSISANTKSRTEKKALVKQLEGFAKFSDVVRDARALLSYRWSSRRSEMKTLNPLDPRPARNFPKSHIKELWKQYQTATQFVNGRGISSKLLGEVGAVIEAKELESSRERGGTFTAYNVAFISHAIEEDSHKQGRMIKRITGWQNYRHKSGMKKYFTGEKALWIHTPFSAKSVKYIAIAENPLDALSFYEVLHKRNPDAIKLEQFIFVGVFGNYSAASAKSLVNLISKFPSSPIIDILDNDEGGKNIRRAIKADLARYFDPSLLVPGTRDLDPKHPAKERFEQRFIRREPTEGKDWNDSLVKAVQAGEIDTVDLKPFYVVKKNSMAKGYRQRWAMRSDERRATRSSMRKSA